jgi:ferredoxin
MKLVLNEETCDGHGQCLGAAPTLLAWGSNGKVKIVKADLDSKDEIEEAQDACDLCPTQSLRIEK